MTQSHRQGIRRVVGRGRCLETKKQRDHYLNLCLVGATVSHHGLLDLQRAVLVNRESFRNPRDQRHSPDVSQFQGAFDIDGVKKTFNGHPVGPAVLDDFEEPGVDVQEFFGKRERRRAFQNTELEQGMTISVRLNGAVPRCRRTGIDSKDSQFGGRMSRFGRAQDIPTGETRLLMAQWDAMAASMSFSSISKLAQTF